MKSLFTLFALLVLVGAAFGDVPPVKRQPSPPLNLDLLLDSGPEIPRADLPASPNRNIMPVIVPPVERDYPPVAGPIMDPSNPPRSDRPEQRIDRPRGRPRIVRPRTDLPPPIEIPPPFGPDRPPFQDPVDGIRGSMGGIRGGSAVIPTFFRDRIQVQFGPNSGRIPVSARVFDMNGRLVFSADAMAGASVTFSGARLASLPSGAYLLQLDCGDYPSVHGRMYKVD